MSFDKYFVPWNPGIFSLPIIASEFLDHALQQKKILKEFLETGESIEPKDLIRKKFENNFKLTSSKLISEDYFTKAFTDKNYEADIQEHPKAFTISTESNLFNTSSNSADLKRNEVDKIKDNKSNSTGDEMPSVSERKSDKILTDSIEQEMNERTIISFRKWGEKLFNNTLICQEMTYHEFVNGDESEKQLYNVWNKGIEILSSRMNTNEMDKGFFKFVKSLGGDQKKATAAVHSVEDATKDYFEKNTKTRSFDTYFNDEDRKLNKRYVDCILKLKPFMARQLNLSEYRKKMKYYNYHKEFLQRTYPEVNPDLPDDFVITAIFYKPMMNQWKRPSYPKRIVHFVEEKKYQFRGDNTLLDLRNKILCSWDLVSANPASNKLLQKDECFGSIMPSSFIFIHDTFYIDMSRPNAKNIATNVINFYGKRANYIWEEFKVKDMMHTKIKDLTFRLNTPYVFFHMGGNCEHTFSFNDLRLISSNDYQKLETYPVVRFDLMKIRRCNYCKKATPCFIILEDNISPKLPALCCQFCYDYLFINKQGVKNDDVVAFHYVEKLNHQY